MSPGMQRDRGGFASADRGVADEDRAGRDHVVEAVAVAVPAEDLGQQIGQRPAGTCSSAIPAAERTDAQ